MAEYTNSVPLGQSGTGSAFVLGRSQAADRLLQTIDYNNQVKQINAVKAQKELEQRQAELARSQIKFQAGNYWDNDLKKKYQEDFNTGVSMYQKGFSPERYDPNNQEQVKTVEDFKLNRAQLESDMALRTKAETDLKKQFLEYKQNPELYYESDYQKLLDAPNRSFDEIKKYGVPVLEKKINPLEAIKGVEASQREDGYTVGNKKYNTVTGLREGTRKSIVMTLKNTPGAEKYINDVTGNLGYSINNLESLPNTLEEIKEQIIKDYDGTPPLREALAGTDTEYGSITSKKDPNFTSMVEKVANKAYAAKQEYEGFIKGLTNLKLAGVKEKKVVSNDFSAEDQALQRRYVDIAEAKLAKGDSKDDSEDEEYDNFIKSIHDKKPDAVNAFKSIISEYGGNVRAVKNETINLNGKPTKIVDGLIVDVPIEKQVPVYVVEDGKKTDEQATDSNGKLLFETKTTTERHVIPKGNDQNGRVKINQLLNKAKSFGAGKTSKNYRMKEKATIRLPLQPKKTMGTLTCKR